MTSADICAAMRERYKQPEWCLFFEVANGTGGNAKRHADALAMNMYPSRGLAILGFEIKVSRQDLKRELENPDKAEAVAQYCNEWWLAVPEGLIRDEDNIPTPWGIIELISGKMWVKKKAQALEPKPVTKQFMAAVLRSAGKVDEATLQEARNKAAQEITEYYERRLNNEIESRTGNFKKLKEKVDEFKKATGQELNYYTDIEGLAERLKIAESMDEINGRYGALKSMRRSVENFLNELDKLSNPSTKAV
jgi:hypothetical protein